MYGDHLLHHFNSAISYYYPNVAAPFLSLKICNLSKLQLLVAGFALCFGSMFWPKLRLLVQDLFIYIIYIFPTFLFYGMVSLWFLFCCMSGCLSYSSAVLFVFCFLASLYPHIMMFFFIGTWYAYSIVLYFLSLWLIIFLNLHSHRLMFWQQMCILLYEMCVTW